VRRRWFGLHQLPNTICVVRVAVVYFSLYQIGTQYERDGRWALGWLVAIILAALTDRLDGFLAKRYGWTSAIGAFLDQISDKLVTLGIFAFLAMHGAFHALALGALVLRELYVSALRVGANRVGVAIRTGQAGRFKTFTQHVASLFIFLHWAFPAPWFAGQTFSQWMVWAGWLVFVAIVLGYGSRAVRAFVRVYTVERLDASGKAHRSRADLFIVVLSLALIPLPASYGGTVVVLLITLGTGVTYTWSFIWGARVRGAPWLGSLVFTFLVSALVSAGLVLVLRAEPHLDTLWLLVAGVSSLWVLLLAASAKTERAYLG
jgi:CDP-diacylglycerol--glycerol-3-phosphate 3-phosphatidyltransferase